jgi:hypothetical protein
MYDITSTTLDQSMPPMLLVKVTAERTPMTRTSNVSEGVEALSQMVKTT